MKTYNIDEKKRLEKKNKKKKRKEMPFEKRAMKK